MTEPTKIATGDIIRVNINQIKPNPYRDMELFPLVKDKIAGLMESIKQTGFWTGLRARPEGNAEIQVLDVEGVITLAGDQNIELMFGHHRLEAAKLSGYTDIDISVVPADDTIMLQAMANENKGDWTSGSYVLLETVRQVKSNLMNQANKFATFAEYKKEGFTFFQDSSAFKKGKTQIGFKNITKFLGETWSESDVRAANNVLEDIDNGLYEQTLVLNIPSVGLLGEFSTLAKAVMSADNTWPLYFKEMQLNGIAGVICDPAVSTTIKIMRAAKKVFKDGNDPLHYVKSGNTKEFDLVKQMKALVYNNEDSDLTVADLTELEGLKGYEGLDDLIVKVQESITRSEAAAKRSADKAAAAESGGGDEDIETADAGGLDGIGDDLDAAIDEALGAASVDPSTEVLPGEALETLPDVPEGDGETPLSQLTAVFTQNANLVSVQAKRIQGQDVPDDTAYSDALTGLLTDLIDLAIEYYGKEEAQKIMVEEAAKYEVG